MNFENLEKIVSQMNFDGLEKISLIIIAILQIFQFLRTRRIISKFANIFSKKDGEDFSLDENYLNKSKEYTKIVAHINHSAICESSLDLIEVRRIAEEHLDRQEDAINRAITVPLYLGLMGTVLGIIFGLLAYGETSVTEQMPIDEVINSVKFAMMVSFLGLLLTVLNQTKVFSRAKAKVEAGKEEFYKFLKARYYSFENEFAPVMMDMKNGLEKFNSKFSENLDNMSLTLKTAESFSRWDFASLEKAIDKFKVAEKYLEKINALLAKVAEYDSTVEDIKTLQETTNGLDANISIFSGTIREVTNFVTQTTDKIANSVVGNERVLNKLLEYFSSDKFTEMQNKMIEENKKVTIAVVENLSGQKKYIENEVQSSQKNTTNILEDTQNELTKTSEILKTTVADFAKSTKNRFEEFDNQIIKTNNEIATAFGKLAKDLNLKGVTKEDVLNTAVIGQMENVSKAIALSFGEIQGSMEQWKQKLAESIKKDIIKDASAQEVQNEKLNQMSKKIEQQQLLLKQICDNTKPRSFLRAFKDFIGVERRTNLNTFDLSLAADKTIHPPVASSPIAPPPIVKFPLEVDNELQESSPQEN